MTPPRGLRLRRRRPFLPGALLALGSSLGTSGDAAAQPVQLRGSLVPGDTVLATPRDRYPAGAFHRAILGKGHRDLWGLPVPARVLDLDDFAGGLTLEGPGGGNQTRSLRFTGADGRAYNFRSIDKDAARTLEPELRRTAAAWILQDQISSLFPLSALVVDRLLDHAGVLHPEPLLRVMPDDPRLGEYRDEFRGMLGWIEERPDEGPDGTVGFAGSERVVGSERLFELLEESPHHRIAGRSLLRARLIDALVGDWDRHPGQWRWARFERNGVYEYEPVPRDRDWSFARIDGAFTRLSWMPWPQYMGFGGPIGSAYRRTWNGQVLDRHLLTGLSWEDWRQVTDDLVARLSDAALADAVGALPDAYRREIGAWLEADLRLRRDELPAFARDFYEHLAGWVDVHTTDAPEEVVVRRVAPDTLRVTVRERLDGGPADAPHYRRDFTGADTREVRLDLHGGDDRVVVEGDARSGPVVRVVGGGGNDTFLDRTEGGGVHFYDEDGGTLADGSAGHVDASPWDEPYDPRERTDWVPARDWGARTLPSPELEYSPDWGVIVGMGFRREVYGFRNWPYRTALEVGAGVATATGRLQGYAELDVPLAGDLRGRVAAEARGAEVRRFYGFGNESPGGGEGDPFHAERREIRLDAGLTHRVGERARVTAGVEARRLSDLGNPGTLVDSVRPYGYPDFRQVGMSAGFAWQDRSDDGPLSAPPSLDVTASWFPAALDVAEAFTTLDAVATASVSLARQARIPPVVALRAGGRKVFGNAPYHEAALLGGKDDLRGFRNQRFAGNASVFVNAELRLGVGEVFLLLPGDLGVFGLVDTGRVFYDGEDSSTWHTAVGGGLWLSFLDAYTATLAVARGEVTGAYLSVGFPF